MGYELRVGAAPRLRQLVESCPWMTHFRRPRATKSTQKPQIPHTYRAKPTAYKAPDPPIGARTGVGESMVATA